MARAEATSDTVRLRQQLESLNQKLEANNIALEEAQALTHLGSWQWTIATNEITWSDELYRIYGMQPQEREIGFESFLGLIHQEDRERVGRLISDAYQSGKPFEFEHRIILPNKKIRILNGKGKSIHDRQGNVISMVGTSQDITERTKATQALHLSDERFKAVTAATRDIVYDIDLDKNLMWFNDVLANDYGFPKQEVGQTRAWWLKQIHSDDRPAIEQTLTAFLRGTATNWTGEYRVKIHSGDFIDIHDRAVVLRDQDNKPFRMIGSALDITHRKQLDQAKDEFISLVSHQLRTPLSVIRTYGEMLTQGHFGELPAIQAEQVNRVTDASIRLIELVSTILDVSKLELNRINIKPLPSDVNKLIKQCVDDMQPVAAAKGVELAFSPGESKKNISLDPMIFGQIIHNFLTNSVRYTKAGRGRIKVAFTSNQDGHVLSVSDNGIGIPKSAQHMVFERFYRANNTANISEHGTGLGLYLVKLLAEACGGKVWFKSAKNQQTTFYFQLPASGMLSV